MPLNKFRAKPTVIEGKRFSSKKEAAYYQKLLKAKESGQLLYFLMQVPFQLPGKIIYRMDFMEFWAPKEGKEYGEIVFTEVKGFMTPDAKIKLAQTEELFNIKINVI